MTLLISLCQLICCLKRIAVFIFCVVVLLGPLTSDLVYALWLQTVESLIFFNQISVVLNFIALE